MHLSHLVSFSRFATERALRVVRARQILFARYHASFLWFFSFVSFRFVQWLLLARFDRWTRFSWRVYVYILARPVSRTRALSHQRPAYTSSPVLYNAAIDSRPLLSFTHAICCSRCNPCPVTASSVQSPLPVSVHKIYFPMRYTGWRGENWTNRRLVDRDRLENPAKNRSVSSPIAKPTEFQRTFSVLFLYLAPVYKRETHASVRAVVLVRGGRRTEVNDGKTIRWLRSFRQTIGQRIGIVSSAWISSGT